MGNLICFCLMEFSKLVILIISTSKFNYIFNIPTREVTVSQLIPMSFSMIKDSLTVFIFFKHITIYHININLLHYIILNYN